MTGISPKPRMPSPSAWSRLEFGVVCHWLSEPFKGFNCQKSLWRAEPVQDSTDGMARCGTPNLKLDKTLGQVEPVWI
jgi:hypothetical protein